MKKRKNRGSNYGILSICFGYLVSIFKGLNAMPDITMCGRNYCPKSKECKRHTDSGTKPSKPHQWYGYFDWVADSSCFMPVNEVRQNGVEYEL